MLFYQKNIGGMNIMSKILRGCRAMWLEFEEGKPTLLGKDSDNMSIDPNPEVNQIKNVLGETSFNHSGYTPSLSNDGYIARTEDSIYNNIQKIANELSTDDETIGAIMTVATLTDEVQNAVGTTTLEGKGYQVPVKVVVNGDGGDTTGYGIPFTVYEDGGRIQGTVSVTNKKPTFTTDNNAELETYKGLSGDVNE